jgi:hypothetical protein|tara:strand:- start:19930 stop:20184 length:255 start_codon:yes stop_codon:yes gene_type:complete
MELKMSAPSEEEKAKLLGNALRFIVGEIEKRVNRLNESHPDETLEDLEKDLEAYQLTRKLAHNHNYDTEKYDSQLKSIRGGLID